MDTNPGRATAWSSDWRTFYGLTGGSDYWIVFLTE
jgi:hypothetical protein